MTIQRMDNFTAGYRQGVRYTLVQLLNNFGEMKLIESNNMRVKAEVYLKAMLNDLDQFIDYGCGLMIYTEHDKKKVPIKARMFRDSAEWRRTVKAEKNSKTI